MVLHWERFGVGWGEERATKGKEPPGSLQSYTVTLLNAGPALGSWKSSWGPF